MGIPQMPRRPLESQCLEPVSQRLGDVVLDPSLWPQVMQDLCDVIGATGAALLQSDVRTSDVPITEPLRGPIRRYFEEGWHMQDLRATRGVPRMLNGDRVLVDQDLVTPDEMRKGAFYNEMIFPAGLHWFAAVGFHAGSSPWALSIQRTTGEGPFEQLDKDILYPLSQKLTEAATLSTAVGRAVLSATTNALNMIGRPAIAIDRFGTVLDTNAAAETTFNDELFIRNSRLHLRDRLAASMLDRFLRRLAVMSDHDAVQFSPIVVRRGAGRPVIIQALPVPPAAKIPFVRGRCLLTFTHLGSRPKADPSLLAAVFGLTPAEARLASIMATGVNPEQAAQRLLISRETARNQLKAVFAKTSTHRQSELVALLSSLSWTA
jgi:DNA-binding CsgD family transcriptional regulator